MYRNEIVSSRSSMLGFNLEQQSEKKHEDAENLNKGRVLTQSERRSSEMSNCDDPPRNTFRCKARHRCAQKTLYNAKFERRMQHWQDKSYRKKERARG